MHMNMASAADHEETQVLDVGSPASGVNLEDPICDGAGGMGLNGSTVPLDDTQNLFFTELGREGLSLYGETQALDDLDFDDYYVNNGIDDGGKTQLVDEDEGTVIGDDGITERTELLSDGDDILDDGASPPELDGFTGEGSSGGEEAGMEKKQADQEKKADRMDSNALTDKEGAPGDHISPQSLPGGGSCKSDPGSGKRSFAAVRAASLRSSGLAAARSFTPQAARNTLNCSPVHDEFGNKQNGALGAQIDVKSFDMCARDLASLDCREDETDLDSENENSNRCRQNYLTGETMSRIKNSRVKKLFFEVTPEEETTSKMDGIKGEAPHLHFSDSAIAGLSYVDSQEPGELSQANALDIVDKLLVVNDVGLSQKVDPANDLVKSPPASIAKGVQSLAKRVDLRSPLGKEGIFDWFDNLEDEGGGEFFSKRKDTFFKNKSCRQKSHSQPPKSGHFSFQTICNAVDKITGKEFLTLKANRQVTNLTRSDSRIMVRNSDLSGEVHNPKKKTKKNILMDMDEHSNPKSPEQLGVTDAGEDLGGICVIGPDTQMAAEAMESLGHGSPPKDEQNNSANPAAEVMPTELSKNAAKGKVLQRNVCPGKRTSSTHSEGTVRRSKRTKTLGGKANKCSVRDNREKAGNTRGGKLLENSSNSKSKKKLEAMSGVTKLKEENMMIDNYSSARRCCNANESSNSTKRDKAQGTLDRTFVGEFDELNSLLTSNGKFLSRNVTPIAHRTRHSKMVNQMKVCRASSGDGKYTNKLMDLNIPGDMKGEDKLITDGSELIVPKMNCSNIASDMAIGSNADSDQTTLQKELKNHPEELNNEDGHEEATKASMLAEGAFSHPKRKRSCKTSLPIPSSKPNLKNPSLAVDGFSVARQQPSAIPQKKVFIRSVRQILDKRIQKRRYVSMHMRIESENMPSGDLARARSSSDYFSSKFSANKEYKKCLPMRSTDHIGSDAVKSCSAVTNNKLLHKEVTLSKQGADSSSHAQEDVIHDGSLTEKGQYLSSMWTGPSKDANAVSPVCMAQEPSRIFGKKSAIARELIRLEATAPTQILKDVRRRKDMARIRVLFSNHLDEDITKQQKKIMSRLGVYVASSISDATHFVTDKFVRTRNMLEAIALGKPVVTHMWLESCGQASCFIDEKNYILRDLKKEKEIGFSMPVSLARACQCSLLQGRRVFITPNVTPDRELIANLVKAAQGQPMERIQRSAMKDDKVNDDLLIISCEEDYSKCIPLLEQGAEVFSPELILNGIVIQKLEFARHRLFLDHVRRTRSTIWLREENGNQFVPVTRCA